MKKQKLHKFQKKPKENNLNQLSKFNLLIQLQRRSKIQNQKMLRSKKKRKKRPKLKRKRKKRLNKKIFPSQQRSKKINNQRLRNQSINKICKNISNFVKRRRMAKISMRLFCWMSLTLRKIRTYSSFSSHSRGCATKPSSVISSRKTLLSSNRDLKTLVLLLQFWQRGERALTLREDLRFLKA